VKWRKEKRKGECWTQKRDNKGLGWCENVKFCSREREKGRGGLGPFHQQNKGTKQWQKLLEKRKKKKAKKKKKGKKWEKDHGNQGKEPEITIEEKRQKKNKLTIDPTWEQKKPP